MKRSAYLQLSALWFFQAVVLGAYQPIISTYLKDTLHFSGTETGIILTVFQITALLSPLLAALVVDRLISARLLFAGVQIAASGVAFSLMFVTGFVPFLVLFALYAFVIGPAGPLVAALTFARLPDREKHFGAVRLWGTVGWIVVAFVLSALWLLPGATMNWIFGVSGVASLVVAAVSSILPHVPVKRPEGRFRLIPREAFQVFAQPLLIKLGLVWFLCGILERFYYIGLSPFLRQSGYDSTQIMPLMSLGQMTEAALLLLTGPLLKRWGLRNVLLIGLTAQLVRFVLFWLNPAPGVIIFAIGLHGFVFAFFYAAVTIMVDSHTQPGTRSGVHQLMSLIFSGTAATAGSLLTGLAFDWFSSAGVVNYQQFWLVPVITAAVALLLVPAFFARKAPV